MIATATVSGTGLIGAGTYMLDRDGAVVPDDPSRVYDTSTVGSFTMASGGALLAAGLVIALLAPSSAIEQPVTRRPDHD